MTGPTVVPLPGIDLPAPGWRLAPGVSLLWRGDGSFQLEHADGGVVVAGLDRAVAAALARPPRASGGHGLTPVPPGARPGPPDLVALHRLAELGFVDTVGGGVAARDGVGPDGVGPDGVGPDGVGPDGVGPGPARRVARGARRAHRPPDDPVPYRPPVATRGDSRVDILGVTRVSAYLGALLGAAGVGRIGFGSAGVVRRRHLLPGGLAAADEGRRFTAAAADVVARAAPRTDVAPSADGEPDLVVVCLDAPMEPELRALLQRRRQAHLAVHVDGARGEIGPLVLPGVSACLRCADLHRLDHDPAWSVLAVQLIGAAGTGVPSEPGLAARVGSLAAEVVLRWLDDDPTAGGVLDGSYEAAAGLGRAEAAQPAPPPGVRVPRGVGVMRAGSAPRTGSTSHLGVRQGWAAAARAPAGQNGHVDSEGNVRYPSE